MPDDQSTPPDPVEEEATKLFEIAGAAFQHMAAADRRTAVAKLINDIRSFLSDERSRPPRD